MKETHVWLIFSIKLHIVCTFFIVRIFVRTWQPIIIYEYLFMQYYYQNKPHHRLVFFKFLQDHKTRESFYHQAYSVVYEEEWK